MPRKTVMGIVVDEQSHFTEEIARTLLRIHTPESSLRDLAQAIGKGKSATRTYIEYLRLRPRTKPEGIEKLFVVDECLSKGGMTMSQIAVKAGCSEGTVTNVKRVRPITDEHLMEARAILAAERMNPHA